MNRATIKILSLTIVLPRVICFSKKGSDDLLFVQLEGMEHPRVFQFDEDAAAKGYTIDKEIVRLQEALDGFYHRPHTIKE